MTKPKTLEQLRAEKERAERQLAQEQHKLERLENRKKYLEKGERTKRTHRLCNLGGTVESLAPEVKDLTRTEMTELMEHIFSLSEVRRAVRHMAITHINKTLVEAFLLSGDIYEDAKRHNVVFVGRDRSGTPRYAHVRGTADTFRQDITGSDKCQRPGGQESSSGRCRSRRGDTAHLSNGGRRCKDIADRGGSER